MRLKSVKHTKNKKNHFSIKVKYIFLHFFRIFFGWMVLIYNFFHTKFVFNFALLRDVNEKNKNKYKYIIKYDLKNQKLTNVSNVFNRLKSTK